MFAIPASTRCDPLASIARTTALVFLRRSRVERSDSLRSFRVGARAFVLVIASRARRAEGSRAQDDGKVRAHSSVSTRARERMTAANDGDDAGGGGEEETDHIVRWSTTALPSTSASRRKKSAVATAAFPLGLVARPLAGDGTGPGRRRTVSRIEFKKPGEKYIARCAQCFGYVSAFCKINVDGFACCACGVYTYWRDACASWKRYDLRSVAKLQELPEIRSETYDFDIAVEPLGSGEPSTSSARGLVAVVELGDESQDGEQEWYELVKLALEGAVEAFGDAEPDGKFSLFLFQGDLLHAVDFNDLSDSLTVRHLGDRFIRQIVDEDKDIFYNVGTRAARDKAVDVFEKSISRSDENVFEKSSDDSSSVFGAVFDQVLDVVEEAVDEGVVSGARILTFLRQCPNRGVGSCDVESTNKNYCHYDTTTSKVRPTAADFEAASTEADALSAPAHDHYISAGERCVSLGVTTDIFLLANEVSSFNDLSTLAPLSEGSGGHVALYRRRRGTEDDFSQISLIGDVHRIVSGSSRGVDATLRVRTSSSIEIRDAYGNLRADTSYPGLYHISSCGSRDAFCFTFDVVDTAHEVVLEVERTSRKSHGGALSSEFCHFPLVQLAFERTLVETRTVNGAAQKCRVRRRQIHTSRVKFAKNSKEVHKNADEDVLIALLAQQVMYMAQDEGLTEARKALYDWFVTWTKRVGSGTKSHDVVAKLVYGLLRSKIIHPIGTHPDERVALWSSVRRLSAGDLARFVYPSLREFRRTSDGEKVDYSETEGGNGTVIIGLKRQALREDAIYILDGNLDEVLVYYGIDTAGSGFPCPPPRGSELERSIHEIRHREGQTFMPRVSYVRGGIDDPAPLEECLVEDLETEYSNSLGFQGFVAMAGVEGLQS